MMQSDFTWREYRPQTRMETIIPVFINTNSTETPFYQHHASMYGFTHIDARMQMRMGNTKNRKVIHYSSELIIDTDNSQTAEKVWERCIELNIPFELWKLNNYKFYLKRDESDKPSEIMVYQDRQFVRTNFIDCNYESGLDIGVYSSPFHIMRAKGAIHEVTHKKSVMVERYCGCYPVKTNSIELSVFHKPLKEENIQTDVCDWKRLQTIIQNCNEPISNKHNCIFKLGKSIRTLFTYETAKEIILVYAKSLDYNEEKAIRALKQAYEELYA